MPNYPISVIRSDNLRYKVNNNGYDLSILSKYPNHSQYFLNLNSNNQRLTCLVMPKIILNVIATAMPFQPEWPNLKLSIRNRITN